LRSDKELARRIRLCGSRQASLKTFEKDAKRNIRKNSNLFPTNKTKYDVKAFAKSGDFSLEAVFDMYENICIATC
jgi:hypothetical protein